VNSDEKITDFFNYYIPKAVSRKKDTSFDEEAAYNAVKEKYRYLDKLRGKVLVIWLWTEKALLNVLFYAEFQGYPAFEEMPHLDLLRRDLLLQKKAAYERSHDVAGKSKMQKSRLYIEEFNKILRVLWSGDATDHYKQFSSKETAQIRMM
jgi:hypothetical protein